MYVYSCKSGQMYKINLLFKLWSLLHEACMGSPVHLCTWQRCLHKSDQTSIPTWQYSVSGHDLCGLCFVREHAFNPMVLIFLFNQPLFNIEFTRQLHRSENPTGSVTRNSPVFLNAGAQALTIHGNNVGTYSQFWCNLLSDIICHFYY